jgi:hypothetical protein
VGETGGRVVSEVYAAQSRRVRTAMMCGARTEELEKPGNQKADARVWQMIAAVQPKAIIFEGN